MPFEPAAKISTRSWAGRLLGGCVALQGLGLAIRVDDGAARWVAGLSAVVLAVVVNDLWRRWPPVFARDVVLITAAVGGLGMLLGSAVDLWHSVPSGGIADAASRHVVHSTAPDHSAMPCGRHGGAARDSVSHDGGHHEAGHATAHHEPPHGPHHGTHQGDASLMAGALHHLTAAPGMLIGMMLFCVPGCLLLCRPCVARSVTWRWWAHGACMLGMLVGMVLGAAWTWPGMLAWAPDALGSFADHHVRMLLGMALGSGVVAFVVSFWPRTRVGVGEAVHG